MKWVYRKPVIQGNISYAYKSCYSLCKCTIVPCCTWTHRMSVGVSREGLCCHQWLLLCCLQSVQFLNVYNQIQLICTSDHSCVTIPEKNITSTSTKIRFPHLIKGNGGRTTLPWWCEKTLGCLATGHRAQARATPACQSIGHDSRVNDSSGTWSSHAKL